MFTDPDGITYNYQLVVNPCALTITNNYLPQAKEGMAYYVVLGVTGGQPPYTWMATGLPPGLYLSSNGILTGTPLVGSAGNYSFTVTVTDTCCANTGHQGFGSLTVAYGTYNISVTIDSSLQAGTTQVSIDNAPVGEISGGDSRQFEGRLGTSHVVSVASPVSNLRMRTSDSYPTMPDRRLVNSSPAPTSFFTPSTALL